MFTPRSRTLQMLSRQQVSQVGTHTHTCWSLRMKQCVVLIQYGCVHIVVSKGSSAWPIKAWNTNVPTVIVLCGFLKVLHSVSDVDEQTERGRDFKSEGAATPND